MKKISLENMYDLLSISWKDMNEEDASTIQKLVIKNSLDRTPMFFNYLEKKGTAYLAYYGTIPNEIIDVDSQRFVHTLGQIEVQKDQTGFLSCGQRKLTNFEILQLKNLVDFEQTELFDTIDTYRKKVEDWLGKGDVDRARFCLDYLRCIADLTPTVAYLEGRVGYYELMETDKENDVDEDPWMNEPLDAKTEAIVESIDPNDETLEKW